MIDESTRFEVVHFEVSESDNTPRMKSYSGIPEEEDKYESVLPQYR